MSKSRVLTGITTTGSPHLGNYVGAIRPAIAASRDPGTESFYFLADYHALVKCDDPARIQRSTLEIAASWLACGLDPGKVYFYRQSDIPEIPELTWLLTCVTAKGLLNRAHAYKAATDVNRERGDDADAGVNAGLYMYPVLMAADILLFNAHKVPVGRDQIQHIEMARDIGQRFNHLYGGDYFTLPEAAIEDNVATLPGLDGRKMSKSYDNTIPLWLPERELRKAIMGIVTDSSRPQTAEAAQSSALYQIIEAFNPDRGVLHAEVAKRMHEMGAGWGALKEHAFASINKELRPFRENYEKLISDPGDIEKKLKTGAKRARELSRPFLARLREAVGLRSLTQPVTSRKSDADRLFEEAYRANTEKDEVVALEVKGPWPEGERVGLTVNYSRQGSFVADYFSSKPEAGKAKKRLEALEGLAVEVAPNEAGLHELTLRLDDKMIGRGNALGNSAEAEEEVKKFWASVELRRQKEADRLKRNEGKG